ncbi:MAG: sodium:proton antiporter [Campylobacteraceae bacterium 4484_166]|nr:MAG: sodium:proton antiporter [Campylobacteraceae bacterium 4484_166]
MTVEQINDRLKNVKYPGFAKSIVDFGFVKDIQLNGKKADISIQITSSAIEVENALIDDITKELRTIDIDANIAVDKPQQPQQQSNTTSGKNIAPDIKNFVMVSSGKGGVGKSTTSVNLAVALAMQGKKVGLLDADIYGPNIPRMMGLQNQEPKIAGDKVIPFESYGIKVMSMGSLMEEGQALIWRGAMVMKAIEQLLRDILWGDLDVLIIDMPPGTGDAQLTLAQSVPVSVGINVTTPQHVALDDSKRSLQMFKKLHIPIAGIIENMSGFVCPKCDEESDIFGKGTCEDIAKEFDTKVLASIPIEPSIRISGDEGKPVVYNNPETVTSKRFMIAADNLWQAIVKSDANNSSIQPTTNGVSACSTEKNNEKGDCGCDH